MMRPLFRFVAYELDLRLALAQSMQGASRTASLARVAADAKARGFQRVARLAK